MKDELKEAIAREIFERDEYRGYDKETRDGHWMLRKDKYLHIVDLVAGRLSDAAEARISALEAQVLTDDVEAICAAVVARLQETPWVNIPDSGKDRWREIVGAVLAVRGGAAARDEVERLREALQKIVDWALAYPLSVFPEPDLARVAEVLEAAGLTLDAVSASNMRHVVGCAAEIARAALNASGGE